MEASGHCVSYELEFEYDNFSVAVVSSKPSYAAFDEGHEKWHSFLEGREYI